jgi:hypothetical protein
MSDELNTHAGLSACESGNNICSLMPIEFFGLEDANVDGGVGSTLFDMGPYGWYHLIGGGLRFFLKVPI